MGEREHRMSDVRARILRFRRDESSVEAGPYSLHYHDGAAGRA